MLLIFDEVVNGFRVSPGGAQEAVRHQARPDDAGENPRRRFAGRRRHRRARTSSTCWISRSPRAAGKEKINHPGTFNANPLSAAAGIATPEASSPRPTPAPAPTPSATRSAPAPQRGVRGRACAWAAYGTFSSIETLHQPRGDRDHADRVRPARPRTPALQGRQERRPGAQIAPGDDAARRRFQLATPAASSPAPTATPSSKTPPPRCATPCGC